MPRLLSKCLSSDHFINEEGIKEQGQSAEGNATSKTLALSIPSMAASGTLTVARLALIMLLLFFSSSAHCVTVKNDAGGREYRLQVLGSRPPLCRSKCMSCRPCMAILVAFPPSRRSASSAAARLDEGAEDESYYLLAWKCRCGNRLFQP